jgi:hypothetical protein
MSFSHRVDGMSGEGSAGSHTGCVGRQCPVLGCSRWLDTQWDVVVHATEHREAWQYVCSAPGCSDAFVFVDDLEEHMTLHAEQRSEKAFCAWPACDMRFGTQEELAAHVRDHTGLRPFVCEWPGCSQAFAHDEGLTQHRAHAHTEFMCVGCGEKFSRSLPLKQHEEGCAAYADRGRFGGLIPECGLVLRNEAAQRLDKAHHAGVSTERVSSSACGCPVSVVLCTCRCIVRAC